MRLGVLQDDGSWRITDAEWPASRLRDTPWTIRNGGWGQRPDPVQPVVRQRWRDGAWVVVQDPRDLFKIKYNAT